MCRLIFMLSLFLNLAYAEEIPSGFDIEISLSSKQITLHDLLQLTVTLDHPEHYAVDIPKLRANLLKQNGKEEPPFTLIDEEAEITPKLTTITYTLEPQRTGKFRLTLWEVIFLPKGDRSVVQLISDLISVEVTMPPHTKESSMVSPVMQLKKELPIEIDSKNKETINNLTGLNDWNEKVIESRSIPWDKLLGILVFSLAFLWAKQQPKVKRLVPKKNIQEIKQDTLQELHQISLPENRDAERFYIRLTNTVRDYFEKGYEIHAPMQTTEEFLHNLVQLTTWDQKQQDQIAVFLRNADRVKFAQHEASPEECEKAYESAKRLLK